MTFGDYTWGLLSLYGVYYGVLVATDFYKLSRAAKDSQEEQEINIAEAVEQYKPVDATAMIGLNEKDPVSFTGMQDAGEYEEEDIPEEGEEVQDIRVNNMEGIMAIDLAGVIEEAEKGDNPFEGLVSY